MPRTPDAKIYENAHFKDRKLDCQKMLDDALSNIETELRKEGHTGKLSNPDGIERSAPWVHKGFFCQVFTWANRSVGFAKMIRPQGGIIGGRRMSFETMPCRTEHEAGKILNMMVTSQAGAMN